MLRDLLRQVIRVREPRVLAIIDEPAEAASIPAESIENALQVIGIWLQLLNIAEESAAMRTRRQLESQSGPDQVVGSFSNAFSVVAAANVFTTQYHRRSADYHRASDRSQARHGSRNSPPHLFEAL